MKKCMCKKSAIVIGGLFIFIGIVMSIGLLAVIFLMPHHMEYFVLTHISGLESKPFAVDSRVITLVGAFVFLGLSVYLICKVRQMLSRCILFNEENVIFVLSENEKYEFAWNELQPEYIDMRWKPAGLRRDFLHITFLKKQEIDTKTMMVSENIKIKKERTFLLPSNYKCFIEFIGHLHKKGVLERFQME